MIIWSILDSNKQHWLRLREDTLLAIVDPLIIVVNMLQTVWHCWVKIMSTSMCSNASSNHQHCPTMITELLVPTWSPCSVSLNVKTLTDVAHFQESLVTRVHVWQNNSSILWRSWQVVQIFTATMGLWSSTQDQDHDEYFVDWRQCIRSCLLCVGIVPFISRWLAKLW